MKNARKHQSNFYDFGFVRSKSKKKLFFPLHLSSRKRNKYVKIHHFLRFLNYKKFFLGGEGRRKLGKKK